MKSMKTEQVIKNYKDLLVWQRSHKLAIELYKLSKKRKAIFAEWEIWKQAIRAAFSVPANIVEGYHSHRGNNFASHLEISRGSVGETQYWVIVLAELGFIERKNGDELVNVYSEVIAMLTGFIRKIRN